MVHKSEGVIGDEDEMDAKTSGQEVGAQVMLSPYTRPQGGRDTGENRSEKTGQDRRSQYCMSSTIHLSSVVCLVSSI